MSTLAETKADLGHIQAKQKEHEATCPCRHVIRGKRPACEERSKLNGQAKLLRDQIKTWFDPPEGAEKLF